MGILQSHLSTVPQSQYGREDTDPRGVLQSLWLQPKVCHHQAQWSFSRAENFGQTTPAFFQVHFSGPFDPASHLGGIRLPLVSAAKSAVAALAALGQKTLLHLPTYRTATAPNLCAPDRSQIQNQKNPAQAASLRTHQTRHTAQTPYPHQNRLLERHHSRLYRNRPSLPFRQLRKRRVRALAYSHRHLLHLGRSQSRHGERPNRRAQRHARDCTSSAL